ncbi:MAG: sensor histidine kinase, partial [Ruminococcus sp.]|nr:sensor histidine kinase [Ruminococcus sp.]
TAKDTLTVIIRDNGCGMTKEQVEKVQDPFFTTRTTRKVGLGVPFFKMAAESTGGSFSIISEPGRGTEVEAVFGLSHIDRMPLGDISSTIHTLVVFNEHIDFVYKYRYDDDEFTMDTREFREILGDDVSFAELEVSRFIKEYLESNKLETDRGRDI